MKEPLRVIDLYLGTEEEKSGRCWPKIIESKATIFHSDGLYWVEFDDAFRFALRKTKAFTYGPFFNQEYAALEARRFAGICGFRTTKEQAEGDAFRRCQKQSMYIISGISDYESKSSATNGVTQRTDEARRRDEDCVAQQNLLATLAAVYFCASAD